MIFFHHKVKNFKSSYDVLNDENENKNIFGQPYFYTTLEIFFKQTENILKAFMVCCLLKPKIKFFWTTLFLHNTEN